MARKAPRKLSGKAPTSARGFLRRFARHEGGNIVEMALVALPFITLMFGVLELGVIFMVQTTLENASYTVARQIRTGELQTAGGTAATFKTAMCNEMGWLGATCSSSLNVDVRTFTQFSSVTAPSPITGGVFDSTKTTFTPGNPGDIVLVRCFYTWSLFTPVLSAGLQNMSGGKRLLTAAVTFRNEPYTAP